MMSQNTLWIELELNPEMKPRGVLIVIRITLYFRSSVVLFVLKDFLKDKEQYHL